MLSILINIRFVSLPLLRVILAAIAFVMCSAATQNTFAATFTVTRDDDRNTTCVSGTDCSLREAVGAANAAATDDTINFAAGLTLITLASGDTGDIVISNNGSLAINGPGANVLTIDGGAGINRIFYTDEADVNISGVTMQDGNGAGASESGAGGAIYAFKGTLKLDSVVVRNNGGDSVFGGGVYLNLNLDSTIINSTFSGNSSVQCGGFGNISGTMSLMNSTISGNSASFSGNAGGGFCNTGGMPVRNSTVTNNSATGATGSGGGIFNNATLRLGNTIIAGNTASAQSEIRNESLVESAGNNLIGDSAGDSADTSNSISYKTAAGTVDILDTPPLLGALQNNGGATPTRALLTGSPAIDKGGNALAFSPVNGDALAADQRGFARIFDGDQNGTATVDIGAFEFVPTGTTAAGVAVGGRIQTVKGRGIGGVRVTMLGAVGETQTVISDKTGYFQFADVSAGETYVFSVSSKQFQFSQPSLVRTIYEDTDSINFVAVVNRVKNL